MSPWKLAKGSEHGEQAALFSWLAIAEQVGFEIACNPDSYLIKGFVASHPMPVAIPELKWIHSIANGGSRGSDKRSAQIVGAQMKAEGVKRGVSDIFCPIPRHDRHGLYIEMKREDGGTVSPEQKAFGSFVQSQGYGFCVCYGWIAAARVIMQWLGADQAAKDGGYWDLAGS